VAVITLIGMVLVYGGIQLSVRGSIVMISIEILVAGLLCLTILGSNLTS
jgi:hypothetical protein